MPRKTQKIHSNRTILIWAFRFIFAYAKINRRALRGSAIAPFLRNSCAAPSIPNAASNNAHPCTGFDASFSLRQKISAALI